MIDVLRGTGQAGPVVGVDVGHSAIKIVEVKEDRLTRWAVLPLPPGAVQGGIIRDRTVVTEQVRRAVEVVGVAGRTVHTALPGAVCMIRRLIVPEVGSQDLKRIMRWEAERLLPYPVEESVVDYDVLSRFARNGAPGRLEVLMVGVRGDIVDAYLGVLRSARLQVASLEVKPLARLRACAVYLQPPGILLVAVGSQGADVSGADRHGLVFTRTVHAVSETPLLEEIVRSLRFFQAQAGAEVSAIVLTGGAADAAMADALHSSGLPPVILADPMQGLGYDAGAALPRGRLSAAVGLARRRLPRVQSGVQA